MKNIFLLLLFVAAATAGYGQTIDGPSAIQQDHNIFSYAYARNAGIGLKGGVSVSNIRGSEADKRGNTNSYTSFHVGAFAQLPLSDSWSLQAEALYARKGFERTDSLFRFDYLQVPVLAVYNITDHVSIHAGPQVGIMMSAQEEGEEIELEPFNTFDYGFAAGVEGRISRFRLGARYNMHFADLRKSNNAGVSISEDIKHNVVDIYLGISF